MKLTVIEHGHCAVNYVVELKEKIPDLNEYGADKMTHYFGRVEGLLLPRVFFDGMCKILRDCVKVANEGGINILNPDGRSDRIYSLIIRRGHIKRMEV